MTLAAHGHQVIWCPGHSRWRRKSYALYGKSGGLCLTAYWGGNVGNLIGYCLFSMRILPHRVFFHIISHDTEFSWKFKVCIEPHYTIITAVKCTSLSPRNIVNDKMEDVLT